VPHVSLFAGFARHGVLHFDNHTNNRLERYHHTIKSVVGSSQVSVGLLIDRLHKLLSVRTMTLKQSEFAQKMKSKVCPNEVVAGYSKIVSQFAVDRIAGEYTKSLLIKEQLVQASDDTFAVGKYTASAVQCSCGSFTAFHLPCRHLLYVRRCLHLDQVDEQLVAKRWSLNHASENGSITTTNLYEGIVVDNFGANCDSAAKRFRSLMSLFTPMASALAELPRSKFPQCLQWVAQLEQQVRNGSWLDESVHGMPENATNIPDGDADPREHDAVLNLQVDEESSTEPAAVADHDIQTDNVSVEGGTANEQAASILALTTFRMPRKVAQRGRPTATRQRTFRVKKVSKPAPVASPAVPDTDENCAECGMNNPPKRSRKRANVIKWYQCDKCQYWYHEQCVQSVPHTDDEDFVCIRCQ